MFVFSAVDDAILSDDALAARIAALESADWASEAWVNGQGFVLEADATNLLALEEVLTVDPSWDAVTLTAVHVYIHSGAGKTDATPNGLGNLIVGYDEAAVGSEKTGSHNEHELCSRPLTRESRARDKQGPLRVSGEYGAHVLLPKQPPVAALPEAGCPRGRSP